MPLPNIGPRLVHSAVWTGTEMIVWGGIGQNGLPFDGARYNPAANTWADLPWSTGAPTGRQLHTATWTGSDMIIWGGYNGSSAGPLTDARYNPSADKWTALGNSAIPRYGHTAVWTGNEVIFWGGQIQGTVVYLNEILSFTPGKTMFLYQKP
jgi:hypothetical protein